MMPTIIQLPPRRLVTGNSAEYAKQKAQCLTARRGDFCNFESLSFRSISNDRFWPESAGKLSRPLIGKRQVVGWNYDGVTANHKACRHVCYLIQEPTVRILDGFAAELHVAPESRACEVEASDKGDAKCFALAALPDSEDEASVCFCEGVERSVRPIAGLKEFIGSGDELWPSCPREPVSPLRSRANC